MNVSDVIMDESSSSDNSSVAPQTTCHCIRSIGSIKITICDNEETKTIVEFYCAERPSLFQMTRDQFINFHEKIPAIVEEVKKRIDYSEKELTK